MSLVWLKRDVSSRRADELICALCSSLNDLLEQFFEDVPHFRPFHYREQAGVSLFVAAAARLGWLPIAEYGVLRRTWDALAAGRTSPISQLLDHEKKAGWADFWCSTMTDCFLIEFKQTERSKISSGGSQLVAKNLSDMFDHAISVLKASDEEEADYRFGSLIAPVEKVDDLSAYEQFSSRSQWAAKLTVGASPSGYSVCLYFSDRQHAAGY